MSLFLSLPLFLVLVVVLVVVLVLVLVLVLVRAYRYGLTDIQEYYANTGALKKAAENNSEGRKVGKALDRSPALPSTLLYSTR